MKKIMIRERSIDMAFLKNLFGKSKEYPGSIFEGTILGEAADNLFAEITSSPGQFVGKPDTNLGSRFAELMNNHLDRLCALGKPQTDFVRRYLNSQIIELLKDPAGVKMNMTLSDKNEHSFAISKSHVTYQVCTEKLSMEDAKQWFVKAYGGYTKLLDNILKSEQFRKTNSKLLIHIVYGSTQTGAWVNMTILPVGRIKNDIGAVLPIELLTNPEKQEAGLL
jgi:hypothetical protein